jgi:hypothetical protein
MSTANTNKIAPQVFVYVEAAEDLRVVPFQKPDPSAVITSDVAPTVEQLAGRYVHVEAPEDLSVHPPAPYENGRKSSK